MVFLYSKWLSLPLVTRHLIANKLGIAKTLPTHVADNRVVQDGYKIEDVERSIEREVGEGSWDAFISRMEGKEPEVQQPEAIPEPTAPFCAFCTSKGFRHTKACTRPQ